LTRGRSAESVRATITLSARDSDQTVAVGTVGTVGNSEGVVQAAVRQREALSKVAVGSRWTAPNETMMAGKDLMALSTGCPSTPAAASLSTALLCGGTAGNGGSVLGIA
jgi:hypothetical protein